MVLWLDVVKKKFYLRSVLIQEGYTYNICIYANEYYQSGLPFSILTEINYILSRFSTQQSSISNRDTHTL